MNSTIKIYLLFIFIGLSFSCFAQDSSKTVSNKIKIGVIFSPDYSYRKLTYYHNDFNSNIIKSFDEIEVPKLGYTTGIEMIFEIQKRLVLETGILLSNKGYKIKERNLDFTNNNSILTNPPISIHSKVKFYYLDLPVKLNYFLCTGKFKVFLTGGFIGNILLQGDYISFNKMQNGEVQKNTISNNKYLAKVNVSVITGVGVLYNLNDKFSLRLEPCFRYNLFPINNQGDINERLYSIGLSTSVFMNL